MVKLNERFKKVISLMEARTQEVIDVLSNIEDIDYAICGGAAVSYWVTGRKPTLRELDLLIFPDDLEEVKSRFRRMGCSVGGYGGVDIATVAVQCGLLKVDLLTAEKSWEEEAIAKAYKIDGFRIVRPEYLILMKLHSGRDKDIEDIVLLLTEVDYEKVKRMVRMHLGKYYEEELEELIEISRELGRSFGAERVKSFLGEE
jgi:hypothetical protein